MTLEEILETYSKLPKENVYRRLKELGDTLFDERWRFISGIVSYISPEIFNKQYNTKLGEDWLTFDCTKYNRNCAGYVITVQQMYHEYRHLQQQTDEWNTSAETNSIHTQSYNRMTDIVRRNFIRNYYDSAYTHNYNKDPSELDTEVYGLEQAIEYFKSDPLVSQNEAKEILFQLMMSEDYGHAEDLSKYSIQLIDDMMESFRDLRDIATYEKYPITSEISPTFKISTKTDFDMTEEFLTSYKYRTHREELDKCTDGKQIDKLLEQTIVMKYPNISNYVPRLHDELENCKKQVQSRILIPKHHVIPVSNICYAEQAEDDFTAAVNSITENKNPEL